MTSTASALTTSTSASASSEPAPPSPPSPSLRRSRRTSSKPAATHCCTSASRRAFAEGRARESASMASDAAAVPLPIHAFKRAATPAQPASAERAESPDATSWCTRRSAAPSTLDILALVSVSVGSSATTLGTFPSIARCSPTVGYERMSSVAAFETSTALLSVSPPTSLAPDTSDFPRASK